MIEIIAVTSWPYAISELAFCAMIVGVMWAMAWALK
mgnify:CR=1 FL=1|tara:strand:- start:566 stop:673 length:108 start_codon:yes stop_codon:yes gene_type:complete